MLQVEHPVTEWISGVNIPSCQLMIGMGVPLNRIPDIRRLYGQDPKGTSQIEFDSDPQIPPSGAPARRARVPLPCADAARLLSVAVGLHCAFYWRCLGA